MEEIMKQMKDIVEMTSLMLQITEEKAAEYVLQSLKDNTTKQAIYMGVNVHARADMVGK